MRNCYTWVVASVQATVQELAASFDVFVPAGEAGEDNDDDHLKEAIALSMRKNSKLATDGPQLPPNTADSSDEVACSQHRLCQSGVLGK